MDSPYPIHDLYIQELKHDSKDPARTLSVYSFELHLLKRIGLIEKIDLPAGSTMSAGVSLEADELWILTSGEAHFTWRDLRSNSPTFEQSYEMEFSSPVRVLVPFGVEFGISTRADAELFRISSSASAPESQRTVETASQ